MCCLKALLDLALDVGWGANIGLWGLPLWWPTNGALWSLAEGTGFARCVGIGDVLGATEEGDVGTRDLGLAEGRQRSQQGAIVRMDLRWMGRGLDSCDSVSIRAFPQFSLNMKLTALIAIENSWHSYQVQWHAKLGICLNVQRLLPRQARSEARRRVLPARKASVRYVEELGRVWWRWEGIRVSDPRDEVLSRVGRR